MYPYPTTTDTATSGDEMVAVVVIAVMIVIVVVTKAMVVVLVTTLYSCGRLGVSRTSQRCSHRQGQRLPTRMSRSLGSMRRWFGTVRG